MRLQKQPCHSLDGSTAKNSGSSVANSIRIHSFTPASGQPSPQASAFLKPLTYLPLRASGGKQKKGANTGCASVWRCTRVSYCCPRPSSQKRGRGHKTHIHPNLVPNSLTRLLFFHNGVEKARGPVFCKKRRLLAGTCACLCRPRAVSNPVAGTLIPRVPRLQDSDSCCSPPAPSPAQTHRNVGDTRD